MLDVCLLGTGGMVPLPDRWLTSLVIRCKGSMILIDCGEGTQIPLKMLGWGYKNIDSILFTHYHADHTAGLPGLLLTMGNSGREEPLILAGPTGLKEVVEGLTVISPFLPFEIKLAELSDSRLSEIRIGEITINSIPVDHGLPCLAYSAVLKRQGKFDVEKAEALKIPQKFWHHIQKGETVNFDGREISPDLVLGEERKGIKVSYCTDTRPTEDLVEFVRGSDLFVCEGMYGDEEELGSPVKKKHMAFSEAAFLARKGKVKELWLTHFSPSLQVPEKYLDAVQEIFANTIIGRDLLTKKINFLD